MPSQIVACVGDSLTNCAGWLNNSSPAKSFCNRLAEKSPGLYFANLGVNGDTVSGISARRAAVIAYKPIRVVVWIGINDVYNGVSAATLQAALQAEYTYYVGQGCEVWAVTITPDGSVQGVANNQIRLDVNTWIKASATNVARVIDAWTVIRDPANPTTRLPAYQDPNTSNHFNDAGYTALLATI